MNIGEEKWAPVCDEVVADVFRLCQEMTGHKSVHDCVDENHRLQSCLRDVLVSQAIHQTVCELFTDTILTSLGGE